MANTNFARGATPVGTLTGADWNSSVRHFNVDASNGTAVFVGDFIMMESDGNVAPATAGSTQIVGVMVGRVPTYADLTKNYLPASTAGVVLVCTDPNAIYEIQEDSVGGAMAATQVGENADHIAGAGSTTTGRSAHQIDSSTQTAAAAGLRLLGIVDRPDNEAGNYAKWLVTINEHAFKTTSGV